MTRFNAITRMDLKKRLGSLYLESAVTQDPEDLIDMIICEFEEALLIPIEHREVILDARKIPTA